MTDPFQHMARGGLPHGYDAVAVAPSDGVDLPGGICVGILVGVAGDVAIIGSKPGGDPVVLPSLAAGVIHWIRASRVMTTNTHAAQIVAIY